MVKLASSLALLLLLATVPAHAADCLQQIDGLIVEYDLPASEVMAGTQTTGAAGAGAVTAVRPGVAAPRRRLAPTARGGSADFPKLPPRNHLSDEQRQQLETKLHEARETEALGNEDKCLVLLKQAESIVGKHG